jgi:hypothetical protein
MASLAPPPPPPTTVPLPRGLLAGGSRGTAAKRAARSPSTDSASCAKASKTNKAKRDKAEAASGASGTAVKEEVKEEAATTRSENIPTLENGGLVPLDRNLMGYLAVAEEALTDKAKAIQRLMKNCRA